MVTTTVVTPPCLGQDILPVERGFPELSLLQEWLCVAV